MGGGRKKASFENGSCIKGIRESSASFDRETGEEMNVVSSFWVLIPILTVGPWAEYSSGAYLWATSPSLSPLSPLLLSYRQFRSLQMGRRNFLPPPLHPVSQTKATAAAAAFEMVWDEIRQYKKLPKNAKKYSIALTAKIIIFNIEHPSKHFLVD